MTTGRTTVKSILVLVVSAPVCLAFIPPAAAQECPELVGRWPYGSAYAVVVDGDYAYFGSGTTLQIADVSDPASPQWVGEAVLPGVVRGIAVSGDYAFVADDWDGLRVVNVSAPSTPVEVGSVGLQVDARDVTVSGDYAYVAGGFLGGLRVIDVSTPSAPVLVGDEGTPGWAFGVAVSSSNVFAADHQAGLMIYHGCHHLFCDGFEIGDTSAWSGTVP